MEARQEYLLCIQNEAAVQYQGIVHLKNVEIICCLSSIWGYIE